MRANRGSTRLSCLLILFSISTASAVAAESPQAAASDLETALTPGMTVWITDSRGREEKTRIVGVSAGEIVTTTEGAESRRIRTTDVLRVKARQSDPVTEGALIGAGVAVASGLLMCRLTEPWEICNDAGPIIRIGAVGAGIGIGIDALIRGRKTIYEAAPRSTRLRVAPILARHARGLQFSLAF